MKCKKCGEKINLSVWGMPNDICYGCLSDGEREKVVKANIELTKKKMENDK